MAALDQYIVTHNHSVLVHTVHTHSTSINNFLDFSTVGFEPWCLLLQFAGSLILPQQYVLLLFGLEAVATTTHARSLPIMDLTRHLSNFICNGYVLVVAGTVASIPFAI